MRDSAMYKMVKVEFASLPKRRDVKRMGGGDV